MKFIAYKKGRYWKKVGNVWRTISKMEAQKMFNIYQVVSKAASKGGRVYNLK